jgi:hypothetical protein
MLERDLQDQHPPKKTTWIKCERGIELKIHEYRLTIKTEDLEGICG